MFSQDERPSTPPLRGLRSGEPRRSPESKDALSWGLRAPRVIMGKIEIRCTECGHEARIPDSFRGKKVKCLRCHAKLRIPNDAAVAEDEPRPRESGRRERPASRAE